jgi:NAD(P)H-dependent flavin oxidoreductase YrpB (nitropropane dioxygenase family)
VPEAARGDKPVNELLGWTAAPRSPQIDVALKHDKVRLIANALGTPPDDVHRADPRRRAPGRRAVRHRPSTRRITRSAASTSSSRRARGRRAHRRDRLRRPVARGDRRRRADPVLAAGGIGTGRQIAAALAMGAQGVWTGSSG